MKSKYSEDLLNQFEQLKEQASKDSLTGLLNRGTTEKYIRESIAQMESGESCALFIVDLDKFKLVNDTLGHQAGDQVLRRTAQILSGLFRAKDIVGRLGGDEFVIFLSGNVNQTLLRKKGKSICEHLQLTMGEGCGIVVTASVGICLAEENGYTFEQMYSVADSALYEAKREGRQRFFIKLASSEPMEKLDSSIRVNTVKLDQILEYIDSGVALAEAKKPYRLIYTSPGLRRMTGIGEEIFDRMNLTDLISPEDHSELEEMIRNAGNGQEENQSLHILMKNQDTYWCRIRITRVDDEDGQPALMLSATDISEMKEEQRALKKKNERLQAAFSQTGQDIWEVDIASGKFRMFEEDSQFYVPEPMNFPEGLIGTGWVLAESVEMFREFARELYSGKAKGYGTFVLKYHNTGCYGWAALSYTMLFDDNGTAVRAVGVIEPINQRLQRIQPQKSAQRTVPESMVPYLIMSLRADLSKDKVEEIWTEGKNRTGSRDSQSFTQVLAREKNQIFSREDEAKLARYFERETILEGFQKETQWFAMEYRRIDGSGNIQWVLFTENVYIDKETGDVCAFVCLTKCDERHRWEKTSGIDIVRNPITEMYSKTTARGLAQHLINENPRRKCGLALISVGGMAALYAKNPDSVEKLYLHVAAGLFMGLGTMCVQGQYSRDKILVFFADMPGADRFRERLQKAFVYARQILVDTVPIDSLRFVAGAVCAAGNEINYNKMEERAARLCDLWENAPSDKVVFSDAEEDWNWQEIQKSDSGDQISVGREELRRPLNDTEKEMALICMEEMLMADSMEDSIHSVLDCIGCYYRADRVYILSLAEGGHVVTMPFEWTASGRHSIQQAVSGIPTERLPILKRCVGQKEPLFMSRNIMGHERTSQPWRYAIFPMPEGPVCKNFLCVENARENYTQGALPQRLIPCMIREKKRYRNLRFVQTSREENLYEELPNLRAYREAVVRFTSENYSSMGAVCLDVPELPSMNGSLGFEYGSRLLWNVTKAMSNIFGNTFLFRTWEAEFVILCPNITQQVFLGRCNRLRTSILSRYPGKVRIGYIWSEDMFSAKDLVEEARSVMHNRRVEFGSPLVKQKHGMKTDISAGEAVKSGRFAVFLQPEFDMHNGSVSGAEALLRGIDENGNIVPPAKFMDKLEKTGEIRDVDLYVLDRVLSLLNQWRERGLFLVPVSVNFSRITLFDPTVLASVLAIQSRYPLLAPDLVRIEIRESGGDKDMEALSSAMEQFRNFGIPFVLDSFGTKYSNLSILTRIKFDVVKLDRSLVAETTENEQSRMLAKSIVELCKKEDTICVAKGIETREHIYEMDCAGCDCGQGFYFDRPIPSEQFRRKYLVQKEELQ